MTDQPLTMSMFLSKEDLLEAKREREKITDLNYAQRLATVLWEKHWKCESPDWKPALTMTGVIDQIDNMTAGLTRYRYAEGLPATMTNGDQ